MSGLRNMIWSPVDYALASVIAREAGEEMLSRLDWMTLKPKVIVDVGSGIGEMSVRLQERYQDAHVISLDLSENMVSHAKQLTPTLSCVCADAISLPLSNHSVDLLFANLLVPWQTDMESLLREWRRVLRPDGLLMFSALGPDTLKAWQPVLEQNVLPVFIDMHDVGDLMLQQKFADPVLDVNYYTMTYREQLHLFRELQATGMLHIMPDLACTQDILPAEDGRWEATYEVVFAHAFVPAESEEISPSEDGIVRVPLSHLRSQLRS
jgi:malonyl-CoA O-methyltransferase